MKRYIVQVPEGENFVSYCANYCTGSNWIAQTDFGVEVVVDGECTAPNAVEVAYIEPTPDTPQVLTITMRQARLQLLALGVLEAVDAAVAQMGQAAIIEWEYCAIVERQSPLVASMTSMMGWTEAQMNEYFAVASTL